MKNKMRDKVYEIVFLWSDQELGCPLTYEQSQDMLDAIGYLELERENEARGRRIQNLERELYRVAPEKLKTIYGGE